MADLKASRFISALVKNLQAVCHGHVEFDENIKVVGHLFLTVDSGTEFNYILNEKVSKTDHSSITFISRSFHATDPQQKPELKPPPQNDKSSSQQSQDQQRFWQNQNKTGFLDSKQKVNQQPQIQVPTSRDNRHSIFPGPTGQNVLQPLHRPSPKRTMSPQNFSNKVPRYTKSDTPASSQANRPRCQDYENITISDTSGMSPDDDSENDDMKIQFSEAQQKLIMQQALSKLSCNKKPFEQELTMRDTKQKSAPFVNCPVPVTPTTAVKAKVTHSQPSVSVPMSVAKSIAHPSSSTHTITTNTSSSTNSRAQVIDVDLTKVKEEPQDAGYGESVSNAASTKYPQAQNWQQSSGGPSGEGEYEEGYEGEGYEGEEYDGEYDEEGYEGEEYFQEGYEGEEYDGDGYEEGEMHDEFMNNAEDDGGNVGVYPVGFLHSTPKHGNQGGMVTGNNQNLMNQQMMASQQQMQSGMRPGFQQSNVGLVTKQHQGPKFECQYCQKDFSSSANLTRHIQSQHFAARINCPMCELTFARKETLKKHILKKHPRGEASCPICEEMFSSEEQMNKHVFDIHRVNPQLS